ncbi:MAG TPA: hypothetical protein DCL35_01800 [Candidatus Omnitrophica bacterium]|nr:hypothetical protein [Candidatus Omnitrophota bacterium]
MKNIRANLSHALLFASIFLACLTTASEALYWEQLKGDHFVINYTNDRKFAQEVLAKAELSYGRIADFFGFSRYSDFWTWNRRVEIFIYPNQTAYLEGTGHWEWSDGKADYANRQISMYAGNPKFIESIVPHEIAHLVFRDFIGFETNIPLWLDEGVATLVEKGTYANIKENIKKYYDNSALLTLKDMTTLDFKKCSTQPTFHSIRMKNKQRGVLSLTPANFITIYYVQATSVVGFLKERYGIQRFVEFCQYLRDGKALDDALRKAFGEECRDLETLENKWREYISQ